MIQGGTCYYDIYIVTLWVPATVEAPRTEPYLSIQTSNLGLPLCSVPGATGALAAACGRLCVAQVVLITEFQTAPKAALPYTRSLLLLLLHTYVLRTDMKCRLK